MSDTENRCEVCDRSTDKPQWCELPKSWRVGVLLLIAPLCFTFGLLAVIVGAIAVLAGPIAAMRELFIPTRDPQKKEEDSDE